MKTDFTSLTDYEIALNWREAINHRNEEYADDIRQQVFSECGRRKLSPETLLRILEKHENHQ